MIRIEGIPAVKAALMAAYEAESTQSRKAKQGSSRAVSGNKVRPVAHATILAKRKLTKKQAA